jgi:hypothetical protein
MKFHRLYNEKYADNEPRYFVGYLLPESFGYAEGYRYEVQLLSENGEAVAVILFRGDESPLRCAEYSVPEAVFRAAFGRSGNPGDYVNSAGEVVDFNGRPVG